MNCIIRVKIEANHYPIENINNHNDESSLFWIEANGKCGG